MLHRLTRHPKRILMTVDAVGGVWNYAVELARELKLRGATVVFAGIGPAPSPDQQAQADAVAATVWLRTPPDWMTEREADLDGLQDELAPLVRDYAIDLVHLNAPSQAAGLDLPCPIVAVSHSCLITWFRAVLDEDVPDRWQWHCDRNRRGFERADAVVVPSRSHAGLVEASYGNVERLRAVHNSIYVVLPPVAKEPTVAAVARWWDKGKNAAVLDAAAAKIGWPLLAIGPTRGPDGQRTALRHAVEIGPLPNDEARARLARAAIFVSPSLYEPFGLAALEAAHAGTALVLADIPTYRELWDGAATFFPPRDAEALADAVNRLTKDEPLRLRLGEAAAQRARRFSPEGQAAAMASVYREAAAVAAGR